MDPLTAEAATDEGFLVLVAREHRGLTAASAMIVGSRSAAEEIVQDVFERTYARWAKVSTMDQPGAWVRRAVINQSISASRRSAAERRALDRLRRRPPAVDSGPPVPLQEVWSAVRALPVNQCTAVALHYGADLSIASVAAQMELSEPAVKALLHRARAALRQDRNVEEIAR